MVQTATLLLVSVFGLLKLSSEDPNVIRNTFLGYRIVRTSNDIVRAWRLEDEVDLKKLLALTVHRFTWLEPDGACYAVAGHGKGIALSHGITTESLYEIGADFDGNRYFISPYAQFPQDRHLQLRGMYVQIHQGQGFLVKLYGETAHIESGDVKLLYPNIAEPIRFSLVAGRGIAKKTTWMADKVKR